MDVPVGIDAGGEVCYTLVGLMAAHEIEYRQRRFEPGYWDARNDLAGVLPLPEQPLGGDVPRPAN
jgi:hypothetical protein